MRRFFSSMMVRSVGVTALVWAVGVHAGDPMADAAVRAAVVPGADLLIAVDAEGWSKAPIQKEIAALREEMAEENMDPKAMQVQRFMEEAFETIGISREDVKGLVLSAQVQPMTAAGADGSSPAEAMAKTGFVGAFSLRKPITVDSIQTAISQSAEKDGWKAVFTKDDYKGAKTLTVVSEGPAVEGNPNTLFAEEMLVALVNGGTVGYVGQPESARAAVDRFAAKQASPLSTALDNGWQASIDKALTSVVYVPGEDVKENIRARSVSMQSQNPMMAAAVRSLGTMDYVVLGLAGSDRIAAQLSADFASAEEAMQVKSVVDMMVLSAAKMMLMQAVGRPIPLLQTLLSEQDGKVLAIKAEMTVEDLRALAELRNKAPRPGAAPMPPPPPVPGG